MDFNGKAVHYTALHVFALTCTCHRPLARGQIAELSATAEGGVSARLVGSRQQLGAAVVHVVLSRFEAHGAEG